MDPAENPYAAPRTPTRSPRTGPTPLQRMVLSRCLRYHATPPTSGSLILDSWRTLLFQASVFGGLGGLLTISGRTELGWGFIGVGIGMVAFIPSFFRIVVALWPLLDSLLDWPRIRRLLETPGDPPAADA